MVTRISGTVDTGGADEPTERANPGQVAASVDQQGVGRPGVQERCTFGGQHPHLVGEQLKGRQHRLGGGSTVRQEQQPRHTSSSPRTRQDYRPVLVPGER